jgi:serine/threonine protein kinase
VECLLAGADVKPANIMVVTYQPLRVVIIDYGVGTFERQSKDHEKGTIPYLAPEVIALKHRESKTSYDPPPYDRSCDIWGLGLTGYQLFLRKGCTWGESISRDSHAGILSQLKDREECPPIHNLLIKMLAWVPRGRPSMSRIVSDPIWKNWKKDAGNPTS